MAITALENFSGFLPDTVLGTNNAVSVPFGHYPGGLVSSSGVTAIKVLDGGKHWATHDRQVSTARWYTLVKSSVISPGDTRITIGWRARRQATALTGDIFSIGSMSVSYTWSANKTETYFEVVIDRSDWSMQLWADGRLFSTLPINVVADRTSLSAATGNFGFGLAHMPNCAITDVYVVEDTGDDSPSGRLGPQDITSVPVEVVAGSEVGEWNTEAFQDVFTRGYLSEDTGTRVTGQGFGGSIQLKQVAGWQPPNDTAVNGVGVFIGATYKVGSPGDLGVKLARGEHQDYTLGTLNDSVPTYPNVRMINNSRTADEQKSNTAFDGFAIDLTLESR